MSPILILILSAATILLSAYLFKKSCGSLSIEKLNMISIIFWFDMLLFSYLGSIIIILIKDEPVNDLIDNILGGYETKYKVWLSVSYAMIALPSGMIISNVLFNFKRSKVSEYNSRPITSLYSAKDSYIKYPILVVCCACILSVAYTYAMIGTVPLLRSFSLNSELEVMQMRAAVDRGFTGIVYIKNIGGLLLTPVMTFVAYSYYIKTKSRFDFWWFIIMFASTFMILTYDASKSPFIRFTAGFVFLQVLIKGKFPFRKFVRFFAIFVVLLIFSFSILGKKTSITGMLFSYNDGISGRVLISQISSLYRHFEIFPNTVPYIGLHSTSKVVGLGQHSERSARIVMEIASPSWIENESGGVYNTLFIGEAYANFGNWGLLLSPLWVGFIIQAFHILLLRLPKIPLFLGLFAFYSYNSNITGGFNEYIYNIQLLTLLVIFIGILLVAYSLYLSQKGRSMARLQSLQHGHAE